jgi:hypothetical protein
MELDDDDSDFNGSVLKRRLILFLDCRVLSRPLNPVSISHRYLLALLLAGKLIL